MDVDVDVVIITQPVSRIDDTRLHALTYLSTISMRHEAANLLRKNLRAKREKRLSHTNPIINVSWTIQWMKALVSARQIRWQSILRPLKRAQIPYYSVSFSHLNTLYICIRMYMYIYIYFIDASTFSAQKHMHTLSSIACLPAQVCFMNCNMDLHSHNKATDFYIWIYAVQCTHCSCVYISHMKHSIKFTYLTHFS